MRTRGGLAQALVGNDDGVLGQQRNMVHVGGPHRVLDEGRAQIRHRGALLYIKEHHLQAHRTPCETPLSDQLGAPVSLRVLPAAFCPQSRPVAPAWHPEQPKPCMSHPRLHQCWSNLPAGKRENGFYCSTHLCGFRILPVRHFFAGVQEYVISTTGTFIGPC